ncbi:MAG: hypothetical protein ABSG87_07195 [Verrucomicrobiota bacterium]|jgi:hypothetical protein
MNELENNNDLPGKIASLQSQVTLLLIALIVVSGTLTFYLAYEARASGKDVAKLEPQARQISAQIPTMQKFVGQLQAYGQAHLEFQPILRKYGISATNASAK